MVLKKFQLFDAGQHFRGKVERVTCWGLIVLSIRMLFRSSLLGVTANSLTLLLETFHVFAEGFVKLYEYG